MGFIIDFLLIFILATANWQMAVSEDCALAGNSDNQDRTVGINARRDVLDSDVKYKFGITYPPGAEPKPTTGPPEIRNPVFTMRSIVTEDRYPWRHWRSVKTPPTNFFPRGSTDVTVTLLPLTFLYVHPKSIQNRCDMWIRGCMRAYDTGYVCAHALHGTTYTFLSYCSMEYTNCNLKANIWQLAYFGSCNVERMPDVGEDFDIEGDNFLEAAVINSPPFNPLTGKDETYM